MRKKPVSSAPTEPAVPIGSMGAELRTVSLDMLFEPEIAMRGTMDEAKLDELKQSITSIGLLYPLLVFPRDGGYEVVDGHRRLLACRLLNKSPLPCLVFISEERAREAAKLHANEVRESVNTAEEAVYIQQLIEKYKLTEEGICTMMHKSPDYIGDRLRLIRKDVKVFEALRTQQISFAGARELNKCEDESMRRYYLDAAIRSGCASRVITEWIQQWRASRPVSEESPQTPLQPVAAPPIQPYFDHCELCGGDKDPGNLISIRVHKWEWEAFLHEWEKTAKG